MAALIMAVKQQPSLALRAFELTPIPELAITHDAINDPTASSLFVQLSDGIV